MTTFAEKLISSIDGGRKVGTGAPRMPDAMLRLSKDPAADELGRRIIPGTQRRKPATALLQWRYEPIVCPGSGGPFSSTVFPSGSVM